MVNPDLKWWGRQYLTEDDYDAPRTIFYSQNPPSPYDTSGSDNSNQSDFSDTSNQVYLGSDELVEDAQAKMDPDQSLLDIPKPQKLSPPKPLEYYVDLYNDRKEGMSAAYRSGHYTLSEVGDAFGVSYATVSRAVKSFD